MTSLWMAALNVSVPASPRFVTPRICTSAAIRKRPHDVNDGPADVLACCLYQGHPARRAAEGIESWRPSMTDFVRDRRNATARSLTMHLGELLLGYTAAVYQNVEDQARPDGWKLKGITYQQQTHGLRQRPHQPVNKNDVQHRRFIDHDEIVLAKGQPALLDLIEDGSDGKSFPAGCLAHPLRGAAGESHLDNTPASAFH